MIPEQLNEEQSILSTMKTADERESTQEVKHDNDIGCVTMNDQNKMKLTIGKAHDFEVRAGNSDHVEVLMTEEQQLMREQIVKAHSESEVSIESTEDKDERLEGLFGSIDVDAFVTRTGGQGRHVKIKRASSVTKRDYEDLKVTVDQKTSVRSVANPTATNIDTICGTEAYV